MDESERTAELLKLSEVSARSGISPDVLKRMVSDDLLPHAQRGRAGHIYFPADAVPTWAQCVTLLENQRDYHLRCALRLIDRLSRELEAVRNDINEAREHPRQTLGVDLLESSPSRENPQPRRPASIRLRADRHPELRPRTPRSTQRRRPMSARTRPSRQIGECSTASPETLTQAG